MVKINLLPHREESRRQRKKAFFALLIMGAVIGGAIVLAVAGYIANSISNQTTRNNVIKAENTRLDAEIKEIATIKEDIDALEARQQAVEDLQGDRNQSVYLLDELVNQVPEGIYLRSLKQAGQHAVISGYAQSNERVSELLRNLNNNSQWLEHPDLKEITATTVGQGRDAKKVFDFTMDVIIKRQRDKDKAAAATTAGIVPKKP